MGKQKIIKLEEELIIECRGCGVVMHTQSGSRIDATNRCYHCRRERAKKRYREYTLPYLKSLPPEEVERRRKRTREVSAKWIKNNLERYRKTAREGARRRRGYKFKKEVIEEKILDYRSLINRLVGEDISNLFLVYPLIFSILFHCF